VSVKIIKVPAGRIPPAVAELRGVLKARRVRGLHLKFHGRPADPKAARKEAIEEFDRFFAELARMRKVDRLDVSKLARGSDARFRVVLRKDRTVQLLYEVKGRREREARREVATLLAARFRHGVDHVR
jgi:hypothetical protein